MSEKIYDKMIRVDRESHALVSAAASLDQRGLSELAAEILRHGARKIIYKHTAAADGLEVEA